MKKSVIIVTALVYILSIILVAFLGYVSEIHNPPVYAEDIIMVIEKDPVFPFEHTQYTVRMNGAPIYDIFYNGEPYTTDTSADEFNFDDSTESDEYDSKYRYVIRFRGEDEFELFFDKNIPLSLNLKPYSSHGECENQNLSYYIDKDRTDYVTINNEGEVEFKVYRDIFNEEIMVSTKDSTNIRINVLICL